MDEQKKDQVSFKDTLNLPRTDMPIRADAATTDPQMVARWQAQDLCSKAMVVNKGQRQFVLHDGPPFVNGPIHAGHAYNKILKDIICKSARMAGAHAPVTPGWDCHGLPIEFKVAQEHPKASRSELIAHCRAVAAHWAGVQCAQFKQLGVVMDWDRPYATMDPAYEAAILRAFGKFVQHEYVERKNKTIPWCATCRTSLAAAEIEYKDRTDPSLYVRFDLVADPAALEKLGLPAQVSLLVWTTTPWTLPLNRAVVVKPGTDYSVLAIGHSHVIVGSVCVPRLASQLGIEPQVVATVRSDALVGMQVRHPIVDGLLVPIVSDAFVALDEGTACVHCAPGCGPVDYELAIKQGLEIYSPLTADGRYTEAVAPAALAGMKITDAQAWVTEHLKHAGTLVHEGTVQHSYPHCWRCRKGLMFRATTQWFISLERHDLRPKTVAALDDVQFLPPASKNHLKAAIESRLEWCISRARAWGVPIPALICTACDHAEISKSFVDHVAEGVASEGIEWWDRVTLKQLPHNSCPRCGADAWRKETDILDVWLDSGVSHWAVLTCGAIVGTKPGTPPSDAATGVPADFYAEARDQARGWFQSSMLTSMMLHGKPCSRAILTHGYTVDAKGQKMSKSLGNVVSPEQLIKDLGADGVRLWVASIDYENDLVISPALLAHVKEVHRKIRNTLRFLLSNLYDFDPARAAVALKDLQPLDQFFMHRLHEVDTVIRDAYVAHSYTTVFHALADFCTTDLSALYIEMVRDRLYADVADGRLRRSAQTVMWHTLDVLTRLMAPILSFTAEQVSDYYQRDKKDSIHLQQFAATQPCADVAKHREQWTQLFVAREAILKAIEKQREQGLIKASVEARLTIALASTPATDPLIAFFADLATSGQQVSDFVREFLVVSQVAVVTDPAGLDSTTIDGLFVRVERALGTKCPRCWQYSESSLPHNLCKRCYDIAAR